MLTSPSSWMGGLRTNLLLAAFLAQPTSHWRRWNKPSLSLRDKYGISKPSKDMSFITNCKIGGRAKKARVKLKEMGYTLVLAYTGSLTEWEKKGGELEK